MTPVTTIHQLNALITSTYVYAIGTAFVAVGLAFLIANMIPWEGGTDKSYVKRRWGFIIIGLVAFFGFYLYADLFLTPHIKNSGFQAMYRNKLLFATLVELGVYLIDGFLLMFLMRRGKFGSILGKQKK